MASFEMKGTQKLRVAIDGMVSSSPTAAATACAAGAEHVRTILQTQFLNGQVIGVDEEDLKNKWSVRRIESPPSAVLGTYVAYARAQEYGANMSVSVRAHTRRKPFSAFGISTTGYAKMRKRSTTAVRHPSFTRARTEFQEGPEGGFTVQVKAHNKRMNLRPRRFLSGAIARARPDLPKIMVAVFRRALGATS